MARWAGCSCFCQFQHREHWSKQNISCFVWIFMMAFFCSWGQKWSAGWFDLTMSLTQGLHVLILCSLITQVQLDQGWTGNLAYWTFSRWDDTLWGQYNTIPHFRCCFFFFFWAYGKLQKQIVISLTLTALPLINVLLPLYEMINSTSRLIHWDLTQNFVLYSHVLWEQYRFCGESSWKNPRPCKYTMR